MNKIHAIKIKVEPDYIEEGYGVFAEAEVHVPMRNHSVIQYIKSGGVWGMDEEDARSEADNELDILQDILRKMNCEMSNFPAKAREALAKI